MGGEGTFLGRRNCSSSWDLGVTVGDLVRRGARTRSSCPIYGMNEVISPAPGRFGAVRTQWGNVLCACPLAALSRWVGMRRRRSPVCCSYRRLVAHAVMEKKGFRANGSERFSLHMRVSLRNEGFWPSAIVYATVHVQKCTWFGELPFRFNDARGTFYLFDSMTRFNFWLEKIAN